VGLTDEELLDLVAGLPRDPEKPDELPPLRLFVELDNVIHPLARSVFEQLQALARSAASTTPHDLLSQAVDALHLRAILQQRHRGHAERALANVDLFLDLTRPYAVRGLKAFAGAMTNAWEDKTRAIEGRPDAQEESVALYTMHAAKGLEWPVVIPVNTSTEVTERSGEIVDRAANCLYCPVFGVRPLGYDEVLEAERAEINRERVRIWYVAATRACELLVLPRLAADAPTKSWKAVVDLGLDELPAIDTGKLPPGKIVLSEDPENRQTCEAFADEARRIHDQARRMEWVTPSLDEEMSPPVPREGAEVLSDEEGSTPATARSELQGGVDRGLVLHKLLEEVLSRETVEDAASLTQRAEELIRQIGCEPTLAPADGPSPVEIAGCVARALALPEVASLRSRLVHEFPVYSATVSGRDELMTAGVVDAVALGPHGEVDALIDWKSDVSPSPEAIEKYKGQIRAYLDALNFSRGLIVFVTTGRVIPISRS
jgi:exodeoxyribonuclease-5